MLVCFGFRKTTERWQSGRMHQFRKLARVKTLREFESPPLRQFTDSLFMSEKIIKVKVSAGAKTEKVEEIGPDMFKVRVSAPPEKGKANNRVAELLAEHFKISKTNVILMNGATYREKTFLIEI